MFRSNQKCKLTEIENQTGEKLSKQSWDEERETHNIKELIPAISRIAISGSATHERHQSEIIQTVKTLHQLTEDLNIGYSLKRLSVYLCLLPRNSITKEEKWHVTTDPVKLTSTKNLKHQNHLCTNFAKVTINAQEVLAGLLGPCEVTFHSEDDKAKVLIRITAASKQALLQMHMEYNVILTDQNYVVAL